MFNQLNFNVLVKTDSSELDYVIFHRSNNTYWKGDNLVSEPQELKTILETRFTKGEEYEEVLQVFSHEATMWAEIKFPGVAKTIFLRRDRFKDSAVLMSEKEFYEQIPRSLELSYSWGDYLSYRVRLTDLAQVPGGSSSWSSIKMGEFGRSFSEGWNYCSSTLGMDHQGEHFWCYKTTSGTIFLVLEGQEDSVQVFLPASREGGNHYGILESLEVSNFPDDDDDTTFVKTPKLKAGNGQSFKKWRFYEKRRKLHRPQRGLVRV